MSDLTQWLAVGYIIVLLGIAVWFSAALFSLTKHLANNAKEWRQHPFRSRLTWAVLIRLGLFVAAVLLLFLLPLDRAPLAPDTKNTGVQEQLQDIPVAPTRKQLEQDTEKHERQQHKKNFEYVDSPGIHFKPPKVKPEEHINEILKRTQQREKEDKK